MPISEIITKEGIEQQEKQTSEFTTVIPSRDYGKASKTIDPIVKALQGNPKLSTIEKLVRSAGCKLVKPYGFILENSGKVVTISQVINYYGINTIGAVRCPVCKEPFTWDVIFYHLENSYQTGHNLKPNKITDLLTRKFFNWGYHNGSFWEAGVKIVV